jgi:3,5-dioxohexanoate:acetyl-CoA acetone transferase
VLGANASTIEQLLHMRRTADDVFGREAYTWSTAGIGYPAQFRLAATALTLGGNVRVGLEDNLRVSAARRAGSNAELVEKAVALSALLDRTPATPDDARELLGLGR